MVDRPDIERIRANIELTRGGAAMGAVFTNEEAAELFAYIAALEAENAALRQWARAWKLSAKIFRNLYRDEGEFRMGDYHEHQAELKQIEAENAALEAECERKAGYAAFLYSCAKCGEQPEMYEWYLEKLKEVD